MSRELSDVFVRNYDPTHTTKLRNQFIVAFNKRFNELMIGIKMAVIDQDCFGLTKNKINIHQINLPLFQQFNYERSSDKLNEFMKWLEEQVDKGLLDVRQMRQIGSAIDKNWMNLYLFDSYKRGIIRARYEMRKAGLNITPIEEMGGIAAVMGLPMHIDRLGLIYTRAYNDLKGITDVMNSQISRVLAQGLADGDGMREIARKLLSVINGNNAESLGVTDTLGRFIPAKRRAEILARTEIVRAHHLAMIQEYRNWSLEGVIVKAEWSTAKDDRVCDRCAPLEGRIYTLDEIEGKIPYHPQCRCIALPYIEDLKKYYDN